MPDTILDGSGEQTPGRRILDGTDLEIAYNLLGDDLVLRVNKAGVQVLGVVLEKVAKPMTAQQLSELKAESSDLVVTVGTRADTARNVGFALGRMAGKLVIILLVVLVAAFSGPVIAQDSPRIGVKVRTLSAELRKQHNFGEDVKGAFVTAVTAGSPAQENGIVVGDVIVEAAGKPVDTARAVAKSIAAASESISLKLVNSKGERRDVTVPVSKKTAPIVPGPK